MTDITVCSLALLMAGMTELRGLVDVDTVFALYGSYLPCEDPYGEGTMSMITACG